MTLRWAPQRPMCTWDGTLPRRDRSSASYRAYGRMGVAVALALASVLFMSVLAACGRLEAPEPAPLVEVPPTPACNR